MIKEADKKGLRQISSEISDLSEKAREKKLAMNDLQGGTFTISSLGPLGGTGFTPIVNAPQVAILGVARMDVEPVWTGDQFSPRKVLNVDKLKSLGWEPKIGLREGIESTYEWYKNDTGV